MIMRTDRYGRLMGISFSVGAVLMASSAGAAPPADAQTAVARCATLGDAMRRVPATAGSRIISAQLRDAGPAPAGAPPGVSVAPVTLPVHCELIGVMRERTGLDGQPYAIRFHLRLPERW